MAPLRLVAVAAGLALASATGDSPIGKVLQLLSGLESKIVKEGEDSQKVFKEKTDWCEDRARNLQNEIKTGKGQAEELKSNIGLHDSTIGSQSTKVEELSGNVVSLEADLKASAVIRDKEEQTFAKEEKDLTETVDMLQRAVAVIDRELNGGGSAVASLAQLSGVDGTIKALSVLVESASLSTADAGRLASLVQQAQAPEPEAYKGRSGSILETLEGLTDDAQTQLADSRKKEVKNLQGFQMLQQSLENERKVANKEMADAHSKNAAALEAKAGAEGDLSMTQKELATDTSSLGDLHTECMEEAQDFEAGTKSRGEELKALAVARKALTDNVTGDPEGAVYGDVSFVQTARRTGFALPAQARAEHVVRRLAHKHHAPELAQLASRMEAAASAGTGKDQFAKIKGLIGDMVDKLEKQAAADADENAYCVQQLAETKAKKEDKSTEIEKLTTKLDKMSSRSANLKEQVASLQKSLGELAKAQAEIDQIRVQEKELFVKNKADIEQGLQGVKMALKVLSEYYATADKAHSSADGASTGIIGLLEVVEGDFTKSLAEMTAAEEGAQAGYEQATKDNQIERETKEQDVKYKTREATQLDEAISESDSDRESVQQELDAVLEYLKQVEERCVAKAETHEERAAKFRDELAGLKQALQILNEETAFVQRGSSTRVLRGSRAQGVLKA